MGKSWSLLWHNDRRRCVVVRAQEGESSQSDADFEARVAALRKAKGQMPSGESRKKEAVPSRKKEAPKYDFSGEQLHWEGTPHRGDLVTNLALGTTLLWLPLTFAAIGRGAFIKFKFTDKRVSVITNAPWKNEQLDVPYQEVKDVVTVGRGLGFWGDMVVTLRNGDKVELRSLPQFRELKAYIFERRDAMREESLGGRGAAGRPAKGFAA
ncbi:hypothetical protein WJX81_001322 [Elliptochloris bilobata]|uniref:YdbS-like PH domain-containing protein n=1 Tax=Elliptochloris bilobata TaxID=381761 RepID=A0AAW1SDC5_9CHLO